MNPDHQDLVRERAYLVWEEEGRPEGCAERHWITAEQQVADEGQAWQSPANGTTSDEQSLEGAGPYAGPGEDAAETVQPIGRASRRRA
jgi:hypothetical protein